MSRDFESETSQGTIQERVLSRRWATTRELWIETISTKRDKRESSKRSNTIAWRTMRQSDTSTNSLK